LGNFFVCGRKKKGKMRRGTEKKERGKKGGKKSKLVIWKGEPQEKFTMPTLVMCKKTPLQERKGGICGP